jgi:hypothetical protein
MIEVSEFSESVQQVNADFGLDDVLLTMPGTELRYVSLDHYNAINFKLEDSGSFPVGSVGIIASRKGDDKSMWRKVTFSHKLWSSEFLLSMPVPNLQGYKLWIVYS